MTKTTKTYLVVLCVAIAGLLHLATCQWRTLKAIQIPTTTRDGRQAGEFDFLLSMMGEVADRWPGPIWSQTDMWGAGIGVFPRKGVDKETARWLGVILPIALVLSVPFVLLIRTEAQLASAGTAIASACDPVAMEDRKMSEAARAADVTCLRGHGRVSP